MGLPKKHLFLLPLDGSRAMTGDIQLEGYKLRWGTGNLYFYARTATEIATPLAFRALNLFVDANLTVGGNFYWELLMPNVDPGVIKPVQPTQTSVIEFRGLNFPNTEVVVATLANNGVPPTGKASFSIQQAGDITFLDGKKFLSDVTIDDTKKLLWSDVELYRFDPDVLFTPDYFLVGVDYNVVLDKNVPRIQFGDRSSVFDVNIYRGGANLLKTDDLLDAVLGFQVNGVAGVDGSFTSADGKTVTVTKGIITSIV